MPRFIAPILFLPVVIISLSGCLADPVGEPITINGVTVPPMPSIAPENITRGEELYAQYCAGCHGADLGGAPDWKQRLPDGSFPPPPQDSTGHTWHHSDSLLINMIKEGGDPDLGGVMPPFGDTLSEEEIAAILDFIKSNFEKKERKFQWWVTVTKVK